jgi:hypothetical protein
VGHDVHAQISAPCGKCAVETAKHADDGNLSPALVGVEQAKNESLQKHGGHNAPGERMELALQEASKGEFFADSSGYGNSYPHHDLE